MKALPALLLLAALGLAPSASAQRVDFGASDVPGCITVVPGNQHRFDYVVTVNDGNGDPAVGATVTLTFHSGADALLAWCEGQDHPGPLSPTRVDEPGNRYVFNISASGCVTNQPCASPAATVHVSKGPDSFTLDLFCVNSPDVVGKDGIGAECPDRTVCKPGSERCPSRYTEVSLSDAVYHSLNIANGLSDLCTDFTSPFGDPMNLGDAVAITGAVANGAFCCCP